MDSLTAVAASGMRARLEALEIMANNIANSSTQGYKADREVYNQYVGPDARTGQYGDLSFAPFIERAWVDFAQGTLQDTGNPTHVALTGDGFLVAQGTEGHLYTRNGVIEVREDGVLLGPERNPLMGSDNRPIRVNPEIPFEISKEGTIAQEGVVVGQLALAEFDDSAALIKRDSNYFKSIEPEKKPNTATDLEIHQGKLESSNVSSAESAVRLVALMRHFEMLQKAVSVGEEMGRRGIQEVAKIG